MCTYLTISKRFNFVKQRNLNDADHRSLAFRLSFLIVFMKSEVCERWISITGGAGTFTDHLNSIDDTKTVSNSLTKRKPTRHSLLGLCYQPPARQDCQNPSIPQAHTYGSIPTLQISPSDASHQVWCCEDIDGQERYAGVYRG